MRSPVTVSDPSPTPSPTPRQNWLRAVCFEEERRRRALRWLGWLTLAFVAFVAFFTVQAAQPFYELPVTQAFQNFDPVPFRVLMEAVSAPGYSPWNVGVIAALVMAVSVWRGWKTGLYLAAVTMVQGLTTVLLKFPIRQPRPLETDLNAPLAIIAESSFPSGHVTLYVVVFCFVVFLLYRHDAPGWLRVVALAVTAFLVGLIGISRLHIGAHWVGDVVAAYLLGSFFLLLAIELYERHVLPRIEPQGGTP